MSSFVEVRKPTEKNAKGYFGRVVMLGTVHSFKPVEFTKEGSRYQQVMIDDGIETNEVKIWLGDDKTIGDGYIGKKLQFEIAKNPYKNKMYYSGFWDDRATVAPAKPPARASGSSQGASNPSILTDSTPQSEIDLRCSVLCAGLIGNKELAYQDILEHVKFIQQGEKYLEAEPSTDEQETPPDDSDIPY